MPDGQKSGAILQFSGATASAAADIEIEVTSLVRRIEAEISETSRISPKSAAQLHDLRIRAERMFESFRRPELANAKQKTSLALGLAMAATQWTSRWDKPRTGEKRRPGTS